MKKLEDFGSLSNFKIIHQNLGKGYSSTVSLIEHKISKKKYALKSVNISLFLYSLHLFFSVFFKLDL